MCFITFLTQNINIIFTFIGSCQILPEYFMHRVFFPPSYSLSFCLNFKSQSFPVKITYSNLNKYLFIATYCIPCSTATLQKARESEGLITWNGILNKNQ